MSEHSKLPWRLGDEITSDRRLVYIPIFADGKNVSNVGVYGRRQDGTTAGAKYKDRTGTERHKPSISADECRANANYIVRAVNCHADLVSALHAIVFQVCQGKVLERDACITAARVALQKAEER